MSRSKIAVTASIAIFSTLIALDLESCHAEGENYPDGLYAKIDTDRGVIVLRLEYEKVPLTVCNFVGLAEGTLDATKGKHYYDGITFHRVIANFMVQGGDPTGTGRGGPGYTFPDEFDPSLTHEKPGTLSMANAGADTNGSQFFITHVATPWLDGKHAVFGSVTSGQEVVNAIQQGDKIKSVTIIRSGAKARDFKTDQKAFDELKAKLIEKRRAAAQESFKPQLDKIAKNWPDLQDATDGIKYKILKAGTGAQPKSGNTVSVLYKGMLADGKVFDSSQLHGNEPLQFRVGVQEVIAGFDKSAMAMKKGEKRLVVLPPEMAYGSQGAGGVIPPNAYLVFELELIDVQ
jgi:peptidylprolyl isomerase